MGLKGPRFARSSCPLGVGGSQSALPRQPLLSPPFLPHHHQPWGGTWTPFCLSLPFLTILPSHLQIQGLEKMNVSEVQCCSLLCPHSPSRDPVTQHSEAQMPQNCSGSLCDLVIFGKEKLHLFHRDGEDTGWGRCDQNPREWERGDSFLGGGRRFSCWGWERLTQVTPKRQMRLLFWKHWRVQSYHPPSFQKVARCSFETDRTESVIQQGEQGQCARLSVGCGAL